MQDIFFIAEIGINHNGEMKIAKCILFPLCNLAMNVSLSRFQKIQSSLHFRIVFKQPGLWLLPKEDQAGAAPHHCVCQQHALLHIHRARAPQGPLQVKREQSLYV